jgi:hypothetical protein
MGLEIVAVVTSVEEPSISRTRRSFGLDKNRRAVEALILAVRPKVSRPGGDRVRPLSDPPILFVAALSERSEAGPGTGRPGFAGPARLSIGVGPLLNTKLDGLQVSSHKQRR